MPHSRHERRVRNPRLQPVAWHPPPAPGRARRTEGADSFPPASPIPLPSPVEDIAVNPDGSLLCGMADGWIAKVGRRTGKVARVARVGGQPLGLAVDPESAVIVCDSPRGLLRVDPSNGAAEVLVAEVAGKPVRFPACVAVERDGTLWFTESSTRFAYSDYLGEILEHRGSGRLCRRDPNGSVEVILDGLHFANGVAISADGQALTFAETGAFRLSRLVIHGPRAGALEVVAANLPGMPDNISTNPAGGTWVAMVAPRNRMLDWAGPHPVMRRVPWILPARIRPKPRKTVWAIDLDADGRIVRDFQTARPDFRFTTGVRELDGELFLASLESSCLLRLELPADLGAGATQLQPDVDPHPSQA